MMTKFGEWLWRLLVLCALVWIGVELDRLHDDLGAPMNPVSALADSGDLNDALNDIDERVESLDKKVSAILTVMARSAPR